MVLCHLRVFILAVDCWLLNKNIEYIFQEIHSNDLPVIASCLLDIGPNWTVK